MADFLSQDVLLADAWRFHCTLIKLAFHSPRAGDDPDSPPLLVARDPVLLNGGDGALLTLAVRPQPGAGDDDVTELSLRFTQSAMFDRPVTMIHASGAVKGRVYDQTHPDGPRALHTVISGWLDRAIGRDAAAGLWRAARLDF